MKLALPRSLAARCRGPLVVLALLLCALCNGSPGALAQGRESRAVLSGGDYRLQPRQLSPAVWVIEGANADFSLDNGCNIINTGFVIAPQGVIVINTGPSRLYGEQMRAAIARVTDKPLAAVLILNLHPDYFLGNQAFADVPIFATAGTLEGIRRESAAYETNLFRLCGDWMLGTQTVLPNRVISPGALTLAGASLNLREWQGHTDSDLVLVVPDQAVVFAGGLVFADRLPTMPHARIGAWLDSLGQLAPLLQQSVVPSHGPVHRGTAGLVQTRDYLVWLDGLLQESARRGDELLEVLARPLPAQMAGMAAAKAEHARNVVTHYPAYETAALRR